MVGKLSTAKATETGQTHFNVHRATISYGARTVEGNLAYGTTDPDQWAWRTGDDEEGKPYEIEFRISRTVLDDVVAAGYSEASIVIALQAMGEI